MLQGAFLWDMHMADDRQWEESCFDHFRGFTVRGKPVEDAVRTTYCKWSGGTWDPGTRTCGD